MPAAKPILVHTCCAVCFEAVVDDLQAAGFEPVALFYNPNIHPYLEFTKRLRAAEVAAEARKIRLIADRRYGLQTYIDSIMTAAEGRCAACYAVRLRTAARIAVAEGISTMTTTLLASPHQKHDLVVAAGRTAAQQAAIEFFYSDWRARLPIGVESARKRSLYRQQYCGCIWSEYERFGSRTEETVD